MTLTYEQKKEALKLMNEGKATPQMLASRYGCGVRQFQKLKLTGLPILSFGIINKRNRDPVYCCAKRVFISAASEAVLM
jgi:hypothetical protein